MAREERGIDCAIKPATSSPAGQSQSGSALCIWFESLVFYSHLDEVLKAEFMTRKSLLGLWCLLLLVLITTSGLSSYAQSRNHNTQIINHPDGPRITQAINERAYVPLTGNTRPEAKNIVNYEIGRASCRERV